MTNWFEDPRDPRGTPTFSEAPASIPQAADALGVSLSVPRPANSHALASTTWVQGAPS